MAIEHIADSLNTSTNDVVDEGITRRKWSESNSKILAGSVTLFYISTGTLNNIFAHRTNVGKEYSLSAQYGPSIILYLIFFSSCWFRSHKTIIATSMVVLEICMAIRTEIFETSHIVVFTSVVIGLVEFFFAIATYSYLVRCFGISKLEMSADDDGNMKFYKHLALFISGTKFATILIPTFSIFFQEYVPELYTNEINGWTFSISAAAGALCFVSVIMVGVYMDPLEKEGINEEKNESLRETWKTCITHSSLRQLIRPHQLRLMLWSLWFGIQSGIFDSDIIKVHSEINSESVKNYGALMYGIWGTVGSIICCLKYVCKFKGRFTMSMIASVLSVLALSCLFVENYQHEASYYTTSSLLGFVNGIMAVQIIGMYCNRFSSHLETAFAVHKCFESFGMLVANTSLSFQTKLIAILSLLLVSMAIYGVLQYYEIKNLRRRTRSDDNELQVPQPKKTPYHKGNYEAVSICEESERCV